MVLKQSIAIQYNSSLALIRDYSLGTVTILFATEPLILII